MYGEKSPATGPSQSHPRHTSTVGQDRRSVPTALDLLSSATSNVANLVDGLEKKLEPAMRPSPQSESAGEPLPTAHCAISGAITDTLMRLQSVVRKLESIHERIEL